MIMGLMKCTALTRQLFRDPQDLLWSYHLVWHHYAGTEPLISDESPPCVG